ncbi:MAG: hypothetical protein ACLU3I_04545 [Acutalibacteraceae bacterium]
MSRPARSIITPGDRIIHPEQVRVARRMIRNYQGRGNSLRETIIRAQSVNQGEQKYIAPNKPNASIHIDSFHDYELCILAKYLRQIPQFASDLDDAFIAEHGLTVLHGRGPEPAAPGHAVPSPATPSSANSSAEASSNIKKQPRTPSRCEAL